MSKKTESYSRELSKDVFKAALIAATSVMVTELIRVIARRSKDEQPKLPFDEYPDY